MSCPSLFGDNPEKYLHITPAVCTPDPAVSNNLILSFQGVYFAGKDAITLAVDKLARTNAVSNQEFGNLVLVIVFVYVFCFFRSNI